MKSQTSSGIKIKLLIAFSVAFLVFVGVQILSSRGVNHLKLSEDEMLQSTRLSQNTERISSSISSYENKISSFVLTGRKEFLTGNELDLKNATVNCNYLIEQNNNPTEKGVALLIDSLVKSEISYCQSLIIAFDKNNPSEATELINSRAGLQIPNHISAACDSLQRIEESNLSRIIANNANYSNKVTVLDWTATSFALILILFSLYILFADISKRMKIERDLRIAQEKAIQSALMKEQFMANMSHEIRTPMNAIIGFASLLGKTKLEDTQKSFLNAIRNSGENLLAIINDILDYSKIEAGMVSIEKIPFNASELLHSINVMFLPKANDKKIQLDFYTDSKIPKSLSGDPSRLSQILINLVGNALKFTNEGNIIVKAEQISANEKICTLQFTVKDTGIGISNNKLDLIFERFTQAETDTNRKFGGSGLGLSIVKRLVELQGGTIRVDSAEGVGSSFVFTIPYEIAIEKVTKNDNQFSILTAANKWKILVAEDNQLNQYLMNSILSQWNVTFEIVENGVLALKRLKEMTVIHEKPFDIILMDVQMPEMNGYQTSEKIRKELRLTIPIIAMTAHVLPGERDKCIGYGMNDYLSKPIREQELFDLISKSLKSNTSSPGIEKTGIEHKSKSGNVTNLEYINELSNGNPAFVKHMIDLFVSLNPGDISMLEAAIQHKAIAEIRSLSHRIKSNISFAGLDKLIRYELSELEEVSEADYNSDRVNVLFSKIKNTCVKAIQELRSYKNEMKS